MSASLRQSYEKIDFGELAEYFPPLRPFLFENKTGGFNLDFKNDAANRTLTRALLKRDFGLEVTLLKDRLCPPVPNRLNYVIWITDLVKVTSPDDNIVGLDIGTGSTAIYPLLACSIHKNWHLLATVPVLSHEPTYRNHLDIDKTSLATAAINIQQNPELKARVRLLSTTQDAPILSPLLPEALAQLLGPELRRPPVAFSMCNPPFYSDMEEVSRSANNKSTDPHAVCTGALVEMITPGGEAAFVRQMMDESIGLQDACGWYTSLLGKMSSLTALVDFLREKGIDNYAITELIQGTTRRWVIAWSFLDVRLPDTLARPQSQSLRSIAPPPNTLRHSISGPNSRPLTHSAIIRVLTGVPKLRYEERQDSKRVRAIAYEVTWTRAARRRLARNPPEDMMIDDKSTPVVVSEISVIDEHTLEISWIRGKDRGIFVSFWGFLSGKLT